MEKTKAKGGIHVGKLLNFAVPGISVLRAFVLGCIIMVVLGKNPFQAIQYLLVGAIGPRKKRGPTLNKATPLIFTGL